MTLHRMRFPRSRLGATLLLCLAACAKPAAPSKPPVAVTVANSMQGEAPYIVAANGVVEPLQIGRAHV